jgi:beta propeller repeat protein
MLANKGRKAFVVFLLFFLPFAFGAVNKNFVESQLLKGGKSFERLQFPTNRSIAPAKLNQISSSHRDLNRGGEVPICTEPHDQLAPAIYGDKIVWADFRNGMGDIYMYDLTTGEERAICPDPGNQDDPVIYGDKIVWQASCV